MRWVWGRRPSAPRLSSRTPRPSAAASTTYGTLTTPAFTRRLWSCAPAHSSSSGRTSWGSLRPGCTCACTTRRRSPPRTSSIERWCSTLRRTHITSYSAGSASSLRTRRRLAPRSSSSSSRASSKTRPRLARACAEAKSWCRLTVHRAIGVHPTPLSSSRAFATPASRAWSSSCARPAAPSSSSPATCPSALPIATPT